MTKHSDKASVASKPEVFVIGLDNGNGKPKGARFSASDTEKAKVAATTLKLQFSDEQSKELAPLIAKLPIGRIFSGGKTFIPYIATDLYEKLLTAGASSKNTPASSSTEQKVAITAHTAASEQKSEIGKQPVLPPLASGLPQNWESIAPGNMILAFEGPGEGYWESIVISRQDQILTLRYRDYPKLPTFERHISTVALINPRPA